MFFHAFSCFHATVLLFLDADDCYSGWGSVEGYYVAGCYIGGCYSRVFGCSMGLSYLYSSYCSYLYYSNSCYFHSCFHLYSSLYLNLSSSELT